MATEEERAIEYRRMMIAREKNIAAREAALKGDPVARQTLRTNWAPLELWLRERQEPTEEVDEC